MANRGFMCFDNYLTKFAQLTDADMGRVIRACLRYHAYGEMTALEGLASLVFDVMRNDIDEGNKSYEAKCKTNRRNRMSAVANKAAQPQPACDGGSQASPVTRESKRQDWVAGAAAQSATTVESELLSSLAKGGQLHVNGPKGERFLLEIKDGKLQVIKSGAMGGTTGLESRQPAAAAYDGSQNTEDVPEEQEPESKMPASAAYDGSWNTEDVPEEQESESQRPAAAAYDDSRDTDDIPDEQAYESGNTVPFSPEARSSRGKRKEPAEGFEAFWAAYPRHISRQNAIRAWNRLSPDAALQETMLAALEKQRDSEQWQKDGGQYIPHPATWLNGRRWEDELPARPEGQKTPSRGTMPAAQYSQRDYSEPGESLESALSRMEAAMNMGA